MSTVIVTGARAPVALHWARLFKRAGHRVVLADSQHAPISRFTRFKDRYVCLPRPLDAMEHYASGWRRLLDQEKPAMVLPTCEEVFFLAALKERYGVPLPLFAPTFDLLASMHDKFRFAGFSTSLDAGIRAPDSWLIESRHDAEPLLERSTELVLKPVWSRFADRVIRRPDAAKMGTMDWRDGGPWVAQTYLPGEEASVYAVAVNGQLVGSRAYRGLFRAGGGASVAFEPLDEPAIDAFLRAFVTKTSWHGQVSFDFRRDRDGRLFVIECNPRAVSGLHFFSPADGLVEAVLERPCPVTAGIARPQTVRLALATYGLADALSSGRLADWQQAWRDCDDLTSFPGDRGFLLPQFAALGEIILLALRHRTGLKAAATADTEWNGQSL